MEDLIKQLGIDLSDSLRGLLQGTTEDIEGFGLDIARNLMEALQIEDDARRNSVVSELKAQLRLLAEKQRIHASNEMWAIVDRNFDLVSNVALTFLRVGIAGI